MKSYKEFSEEYSQLDELRNPFKRRPRIRKPKGGDALDPPKGKKGNPITDFAGGAIKGLGWGGAAALGQGITSGIINTAKDLVGKGLKTDEGGEKKSAASGGLKAVEKHT